MLPAVKDAVRKMFDDKSSKYVEMIPLSNDTAARRTNEMYLWTEDQLIQRVSKSKFFSLQLDELTNVQGLCFLYLYVLYETTSRIKIRCYLNQSLEILVMKFSRLSII